MHLHPNYRHDNGITFIPSKSLLERCRNTIVGDKRNKQRQRSKKLSNILAFYSFIGIVILLIIQKLL